MNEKIESLIKSEAASASWATKLELDLKSSKEEVSKAQRDVIVLKEKMESLKVEHRTKKGEMDALKKKHFRDLDLLNGRVTMEARRDLILDILGGRFDSSKARGDLKSCDSYLAVDRGEDYIIAEGGHVVHVDSIESDDE